jgi:hypothetical protein
METFTQFDMNMLGLIAFGIGYGFGVLVAQWDAW